MKTAYLQEQQTPDWSMSAMENKNEIEELWSSESEFKEDTAVKKKKKLPLLLTSAKCCTAFYRQSKI